MKAFKLIALSLMAFALATNAQAGGEKGPDRAARQVKQQSGQPLGAQSGDAAKDDGVDDAG